MKNIFTNFYLQKLICFWLLSSSSCLCFAFSALVNANEANIKLRVSAYLSPLSHSVQYIYNPWMKKITEASNGRIKFDKYWGGGLGRNPYKQFDLVKVGITDIGLVQPSYTPGQFPQMQAFELPFLMRSSTEASIVAWKLYEQGFLTGFEDVKLLGLWTAEPSNLYARKPIQKYENINALKIRSAGRLEGDFLRQLNAVPEALHPADAVEALRRGTIDGAIQGWIAINTFQTYRETSHVITAPLGVVTFGLMMNKKAWEKIPKELQTIIDENSGLHIALIGGQAYDKRQTEISAKLKSDGHLIFIESDREELRKMQTFVQPIADTWAKRTKFGAETLESIDNILRQIRERESSL